MLIVILETKNEVGEAIRLIKETDAERYELHRGHYYGLEGRWEIKGTYGDLANAVGVYCCLIPGLAKEVLVGKED